MVLDFNNEKEKDKPAIPYLIEKWKTRKIRKKMQEIEMYKLEIEKARLHKELKQIVEEINNEEIKSNTY